MKGEWEICALTGMDSEPKAGGRMRSWRKTFWNMLALVAVASPGAHGADLAPGQAETVFTAPTTVFPSGYLAQPTEPSVPAPKKPSVPPVLPKDLLPAPEPTEPSINPKLPIDPKAIDRAPDAFAGATEAGTQPGEMFDARMFGDQFGVYTATIRRQILIPQQIVIPRQSIVPQQSVVQQQVNSTRSVTDTVMSGGSPTVFTNNPPSSGTPTILNFTTGAVGNSIFGQAILVSPAFTSSGTVSGIPTQTPLLENAGITLLAANLAQPGEQVFYRSGVANTTGADISGIFPANVVQTYDYVSAQIVSVVVPLPPLVVPLPSLVVPLPPLVVPTQVVAYLPLPSGGGVVGATKLTDGNSPIPRDRFIFDFDYFSNTPLAINGFDVYRFSPGIEKTFFNGRASVELRAPFASSIDSSSNLSGISNRATAFGDVHMTFKGLFYASERVNLATGVGLSLPTGYDTQVRFADGTDLIRIKNRSVLIAPYIAGLFTPTERLYVQNWAQVNFDGNGSPVYVNPDLNGLQQAGRLRNQTLLQLDSQVGYWLKQDKTGQDFLTALSLFVELHYTTALDNAGSVQSGNLSITSTNNRFDELNLTTGVNAVIQQRLSALLGVVLPLRTGGDRFFDYQIGVRLNYFFGPDPTPRTYVSNY